MKSIGENIKSLREKAGMTQDALAEAIDVNRVTLVKYESNKSVPGSKVLSRIAAVLHVSSDVLLGNGGEDMSEEEREVWDLRESVRREPERMYLFSLAKDADIANVRRAIAIIDALEANDK